ncbi:hypothetical protein LEP1GSC116_3911 [Leptospira interrogans serovar Icterohaemorrhagiae str. Verdun HP]|uniref:Uncharacterized protein n=1 Tax=Leptospira interrogans serovar Icterohaemorrhagiae str. Verdun HP TaxID=1049910 RepID=M6RM80_LEPIR|nr:hypothetical protein LEP1GSC116_3911 [Leptospira interrogans serovar Icterohaemorrhagiae str. Verdun HP]
MYNLERTNSISVVEMETKGNLSWHRIPSKAYAEGTEPEKKCSSIFMLIGVQIVKRSRNLLKVTPL